MISASAPGKLVLAGEYAVLSGAWALATAVDRRALVRLGDGSGQPSDGSPGPAGGSAIRGGLPKECEVTRTLAEQALGKTHGPMTLDVSALRQDGQKLGLGSSAAAAAATAAAVLAANGGDPSSTEGRAKVLGLALAGHRAVAPEGSGIDVAASVLGGHIAFRRSGEGVETRALAWPSALHLCVVFTGKEARTSDLVARVGALAAADPVAHASAIDRIARAAQSVIDAVERRDCASAVDATREHGRAMAALGDAASAPIVEERLALVSTLAEAQGGASKPSGAGGGDVAIALFASDDAARRFEIACGERGLAVLALRPGEPGARVEGNGG